VLLIALGAQNAAEVLKHLSDREVETLSLEMSALERVRPEDADLVLAELAERVIATEAVRAGGLTYAREVLEHLMGPERAKEVLAIVSEVQEGKPFDFVRRTPPEQIAAFLVDESPQTIALVIANLSPGVGAKVLAELPGDLQPDVALRIALMGETSPHVVRDVAQGLRDKLSNVLEHEFSSGRRRRHARRAARPGRPLDRAHRSARTSAPPTRTSPRRSALACSPSRTCTASATATCRSCCARSTRRTSRSPCAACPTTCTTRSRATCPPAPPTCSARTSKRSRRSASTSSRSRRAASSAVVRRLEESGNIVIGGTSDGVEEEEELV
jgi:flagellar motor switch protein FliG